MQKRKNENRSKTAGVLLEFIIAVTHS